MSWKEKFNFKKQSDAYTPLHISRSDQEEHVSLKGNEFMVHCMYMAKIFHGL